MVTVLFGFVGYSAELEFAFSPDRNNISVFQGISVGLDRFHTQVIVHQSGLLIHHLLQRQTASLASDHRILVSRMVLIQSGKHVRVVLQIFRPRFIAYRIDILDALLTGNLVGRIQYFGCIVTKPLDLWYNPLYIAFLLLLSGQPVLFKLLAV